MTVKRLASAAHMSTRSFIRAFREATGTAPAAWVRAQRVREAQRLLESTGLAIEQVAAACGFGNAVTMRQVFGRVLSTTPSAYRRRFRTTSPRSPSPSRASPTQPRRNTARTHDN